MQRLHDSPFSSPRFHPGETSTFTVSPSLDARLIDKVAAQYDLIQAALCEGADWTTRTLCVNLQGQLADQLAKVFPLSSTQQSPDRCPDSPLYGEGRHLSREAVESYLQEEGGRLKALLDQWTNPVGPYYCIENSQDDDNEDDVSEIFSSGTDSSSSQETVASPSKSTDASPSKSAESSQIEPNIASEEPSHRFTHILNWGEHEPTDEQAWEYLQQQQIPFSAIKLKGCQSLSSRTFQRIVDLTNNLKALSVHNAYIPDECLMGLAEKSHEMELLTLPNRRLSEELLWTFAHKGGTWRALCLAWSGASDEVLRAFLRQPQDLRAINLIGTNASPDTIEFLAENSRNLRVFKLDDVLVTEETLCTLVRNNPHLTTLILGSSLDTPNFRFWLQQERPDLKLSFYEFYVPATPEASPIAEDQYSSPNNRNAKRQRNQRGSYSQQTPERAPLTPIRPSPSRSQPSSPSRATRKLVWSSDSGENRRLSASATPPISSDEPPTRRLFVSPEKFQITRFVPGTPPSSPGQRPRRLFVSPEKLQITPFVPENSPQ